MKIKGNRARLLARCRAHVATSDPRDEAQTQERARGRTERRRVVVYSAPPDEVACSSKDAWPEIGSVVLVERSGERQGHAYASTSLYVTSLRCSASAMAEVIRSHWHVENRLHWCKDALMKEDSGGVRAGVGVVVLSLLRSAALSVLRHAGEWSPTAARSRLANRVGPMMKLLRS